MCLPERVALGLTVAGLFLFPSEQSFAGVGDFLAEHDWLVVSLCILIVGLVGFYIVARSDPLDGTDDPLDDRYFRGPWK